MGSLNRSRQRVKAGIVTAIALMISALPCATGPVVAEQAVTLRIGGTGAALGGMQLLANEFMKQHPDIHVDVLPSLGSGGGIKALAANKIGLALSSRPLEKAEEDQGLQASEYGHTPMVFATRYDNPVENITHDQMVALYAGEHQTWPNGVPVRLVMRPEQESDTDIIRAISPAMDKAVKIALHKKDVHTAIDDQDNAAALEKIPGSLGLIALAQITTEERRIKPLTFNGLSGTVEALHAGKYPYINTHYAIMKSRPAPEALAFFRFISSPEGRKILRESGYVLADKPSGSKM
jgi:phosphate transport system substrate-binding protein